MEGWDRQKIRGKERESKRRGSDRGRRVTFSSTIYSV